MTRFITSSFSHLILLIGILMMVVPVWMIFASSTHTSSMINMNGLQMFLGDSFYENYLRVLLYQGGFFKEITALKMFFNSFIMATGVAILSVVTSLMAAYALVYYRIKHATLLFWIIFITILVPLELRIFPTYSVMAELNLVNSYFGLIVPISASAIATLFFRQFYKTVPDELLESAKLDGANTWRFFVDFLIPLSKTMIVAMLIFMFVFGYNQYLWPLLVTTSEQYWTVVMGLKMMSGSIVHRFAFVMMSMVPPILIIIVLQKHFIKGVFQDK
jgi:sn-glycerol 3-phosphate transport system permease protein